MDPFVIIIFGLVAALVLWLLFLGRYHPRSGSDVLDWRPTRSPEVEVQNEIDDLDQMLEASNERRRRRGADELTLEGVEHRVAEDLREQTARRDAYLDDQDLTQTLEAINERRRRRGEPELSEAEYRETLN